MPPGWPPWLLPLGLALLVGLITVDGGFVYDDQHALQNSPVVQAQVSWAQALQRDFWGRDLGLRGDAVSWRPLLPLLWRGLWQLGAGSALPFRLLTVLLHAGATLAVVAAVRAWRREARDSSADGVALAAGALFAVHASHAEAVGALVSQADLLATLLGTWALLGLFRAQTWRQALLAALWLGPAILAKESAVLFGLAGLAWLVAQRRGGFEQRRGRHALAWTAGWMPIALISLRMQALAFGGKREAAVDNVLAAMPAADRWLAGLSLVARQALMTVVPAGLAPSHGYAAYTADVADLLPAALLGGLLIAVGLGAGIWALVKQKAWLALGLVIYAGPLIAGSHLLFVGPTELAERLLYPATAVPAAALALAMQRGVQTRARQRLALGLLLLAMAAANWQAQRPWHQPLALWQRGAETEPKSWRIQHNLGTELARAGQVEEGLWHLLVGVWLRRQLPKPVDFRLVEALELLPTGERLRRAPAVLGGPDACGLIDALAETAYPTSPADQQQTRAILRQHTPCPGP